MKVTTPPVYIETERLILRPPKYEDAEIIYKRYASDVEVTKYLIWSPHRSVQETVAFISRCINCWEDGAAFPYIISLKSTKEIIGMIELRSTPPKAEVGYVSAREYWGNGYMTEALMKIIDIGFEFEDIYRVFAMCDNENLSSRRILEKAGMQLEGIMRYYALFPFFGSEPRDCCCYAITRNKPSR